MPSVHVNDSDIPPLPPTKTAEEILADFMEYLFKCAKTYIEESHANGRDVWKSFEDNIDFVLSHPNGWEGPQQAQIRQAAVLAGLVPDTQEGQARIRLVTEGEASLHYCLGCKQAADGFQVTCQPGRNICCKIKRLQENVGVMVIDAGGGTIDVSSYYMVPPSQTFLEIAPAECRFTVFVLGDA